MDAVCKASDKHVALVGIAAGLGSCLLADHAFAASPHGTSLPVLHQHAVSEPKGHRIQSQQDGLPLGVCAAVAMSAAATLATRASLAAKSGMTRSSATKAERRLVSLAAFENELGVQSPVGYWDPMGYSADGSMAAFKRRRSVELKHGRVCMMAATGYIHPEVAGKWQGYLSPSTGLKFQDIPNGLGAISKVPALGWAQIIGLCGLLELSTGFTDYKTGTPGDFGWKAWTSQNRRKRRGS